MTSNKNTAQLSKNVLQMKFMQRSVLRIEQEQNKEEQQKIIDDEHWVLDLPDYKTKESPFLRNQSYITCEQLVFGRQSYQGFNPEIEKVMKTLSTEQELKRAEVKEKEDSVSDQDMARRLSSLARLIAKKFGNKRSKNDLSEDDDEPRRKKAFIKPIDD